MRKLCCRMVLGNYAEIVLQNGVGKSFGNSVRILCQSCVNLCVIVTFVCRRP